MRVIILLLATNCMGEIIKCPDGIWREGSCTESTKPAVKPTVDSDLSERRRIYTDLDLEAFRARRDGRGDIDLSKAKEDCLGESAKLETCRATVSEVFEKIKPLPTPIVQVVDQSIESTQVIVVNEENNFVRPTRRPTYPTEVPYSRPTEKPKKYKTLRGGASN